MLVQGHTDTHCRVQVLAASIGSPSTSNGTSAYGATGAASVRARVWPVGSWKEEAWPSSQCKFDTPAPELKEGKQFGN